MFDRIRSRLRTFVAWGRDFPPPRVADNRQALEVRASLDALYRASPGRFARLFLREVPLLARRRDQPHPGILAGAGLIERAGPFVWSACARVFPFRDRFIATDLLARKGEDQVFSLMFEQVYLVRNMGVRPGDDVLELCAGSGVNCLFAADVARSVTGVDVSERALGFARFNRALNGAPSSLTFAAGSLFEPIGDRRFDLVLVNPPFELVPPGESWFLHSNGGPDGLDVVRRILDRAPAHLGPEGRFEIISWSPGDPDRTVLVDLLREAFPAHRVEVHCFEDTPIEAHTGPFEECDGYGDWREWLRTRGHSRVRFLFARVSRDGPPGVDLLDVDEEVAACHAESDRWR